MRPHAAAGAMLVELLTAMLVLAVLATLAAPAFASLLERGRVQAADQDFVAALHLARETAARSEARMLVCPGAEGTRCIDDGCWEAGWIVAIDRDRDGQHDAAPLLRSDRIAVHGSIQGHRDCGCNPVPNAHAWYSSRTAAPAAATSPF